MELSNVQIEKILGRKITNNEDNNYGLYIRNKVCLITGGGSVGEALIEEIMKYTPKQIHIVENCENKVFELKQKFLIRNKHLSENIFIHLADAKCFQKMKYLYKEFNPDIVFHTAAYKHVKIMEENPEEAVNNNVKGTLNIVRLAYKYKCERFVLVSSDKAVYPVNIMGMTKRICEMIIYYFAKRSKFTYFSTVRLVNVFASSGSIVPLIIKQVEGGGPIIITSKEVERFFMTMSEAVHLIIKAGDANHNGQVIVVNMDRGVNIDNMAKQIVDMLINKESSNIDFVYIGLDNNEKMKEQILYENEIPHRKNNNGFTLIADLCTSMGVYRFYFELYYLLWLCKKMNKKKMTDQLKRMIKLQ